MECLYLRGGRGVRRHRRRQLRAADKTSLLSGGNARFFEFSVPIWRGYESSSKEEECLPPTTTEKLFIAR